jgi:hypothetical protein
MPKTEVTIISAQVPKETRVELERRAQDGYRSISAEIRLALDEHLRHERHIAARLERAKTTEGAV